MGLRLWGEQGLEGGYRVPLAYETVSSIEPETFRFSMEAEGDDALKRLVGCVLIIKMPPNGLDEALTSLRDMWEFWDARSPFGLPERTGIETTASVISARVRPELVLPD